MGDVNVQDWQRFALTHPCRSADEYTDMHRHTIIRGGQTFYICVYFHWERPSAAIWIAAVSYLQDDAIVPLCALESQTTSEFLIIGKLLLTGCGRSKTPMLLPPEELGYRFVKIPTDAECAVAREWMDRLPEKASVLRLENLTEAEIKELMNDGDVQTHGRGTRDNREIGESAQRRPRKRAIRIDA